ncbi:MAG: excinuclease ABC subunit UvrA, partial [Bacteroidetes bacterium]|nr:excinuclease ABC subunit UvrA [Bacteroidota bacterium]
RDSRMKVKVNEQNIYQFGELNFGELRAFLDSIQPERNVNAGNQILTEIKARLDLLLGIGLDYLNFNRTSGTLSGGEAQRIRLSTQIGSGLMGMLYVLDEPSIGLHPKDNEKMIATLNKLRDLGNTVIVVEHDEETIRAADHIVEMGPGPGIHGGTVVVKGSLEDVMNCDSSPTGQFLSGKKSIPIPKKRRKGNGKSLMIKGARENNLKNIDVEIPLGKFVCITGASGSGKSTLVNDILSKKLYSLIYDSRILSGEHDTIEGVQFISKVTNIDQAPLGRNSRSNPATYVGFYDDIRKLFASTKLSKNRGYKPGRFSFNVHQGRCPECSGEGTIRTKLYFMPDVERLCDTCKGARFNPQTLEVTYKDKNIADILDMSIEEGKDFFVDVPTIQKKIQILDDLGLGYLTLGQSSTTLSGGEAQRVKLATELSKLRRGQHTLYILDEPTTGLHLADISRLLYCLNRLIEAGNSVLVIEHHLDVIKTADHIIDLGPEGGHSGGEVIAVGTPEVVASTPRSHTGRFLKDYL